MNSSSAAHPLAWEEVLSVILRFNGTRVAVMISGPETGWLPIAYLRGVLTRGSPSSSGGEEVLMFRVADEGAVRDDSGFFLLHDRFLTASWDETGNEVTVETRDGVVRLFTDPEDLPAFD